MPGSTAERGGQSEATPNQPTQSYIWPYLGPEKEILCRSLRLLCRPREHDPFSAVSVGPAGTLATVPSCLWLGGGGRESGSVALRNDQDEFIDSPQLALLGECSSPTATVPLHMWAWGLEEASFPVSPRDSLKGLGLRAGMSTLQGQAEVIKTVKTEKPKQGIFGIVLDSTEKYRS